MTTTSTSTKATPGTGVRLGSPYARWEARLEELAAFVDEHGGLPMQTGRVARDAGAGVAAVVAERSLAAWLANQRKAALRGTLPGDRAAALGDRVPGWGE